MKTLITLIALTISTASLGQVEFKVNSKVESISGSFKNVNVKMIGNKITGKILVKSMTVSKAEKRNDLLEYFNAGNFPHTSFKASVKGDKLSGEYILKGKIKKLVGTLSGKTVKFKIPLTDLVTGFKAMFLGDNDHVEMKVKLK